MIRAMTTAMDESIANIVEQLKCSGLWDNTIIVFTSGNYLLHKERILTLHLDNGGKVSNSANYPLRFRHSSHAEANPDRGGKGARLEGGIRVPALINGGHNLIPGQMRGKTLYG